VDPERDSGCRIDETAFLEYALAFVKSLFPGAGRPHEGENQRLRACCIQCGEAPGNPLANANAATVVAGKSATRKLDASDASRF
jgi:hypothetical protein